MLSTPDTHELPERFGAYFGRAADILLTGHFFSLAIEPAEVPTDDTTDEEFALPGILTTDIIVINQAVYQQGLSIVGARVDTDNILTITFLNTTGAGVVPTPQTIQVLAVRRIRE